MFNTLQVMHGIGQAVSTWHEHQEPGREWSAMQLPAVVRFTSAGMSAWLESGVQDPGGERGLYRRKEKL